LLQRELGLSDEAEGIWVLPGAPAIGTPLAAIAGGGETILDVEVTSNRTDCLSVRGIAREIAAAGGGSLSAPKPLTASGSAPLPDVAIENPADCPRYMARVVRGVTIGPSPEWLRKRLEAAGFRAINNVVDATNYVLREYGQPIHAFDAAKVGGNAIRVRRARTGSGSAPRREGTRPTRESGHRRRDAPVALAGVMGGSSGVTAATRDVIPESAHRRRAHEGLMKAPGSDRRRRPLRAGNRSVSVALR
jgi:phenylalanyl-tRNA synthetase beta chain